MAGMPGTGAQATNGGKKEKPPSLRALLSPPPFVGRVWVGGNNKVNAIIEIAEVIMDGHFRFSDR